MEYLYESESESDNSSQSDDEIQFLSQQAEESKQIINNYNTIATKALEADNLNEIEKILECFIVHVKDAKHDIKWWGEMIIDNHYKMFRAEDEEFKYFRREDEYQMNIYYKRNELAFLESKIKDLKQHKKAVFLNTECGFIYDIALNVSEYL